MAATTSSSNSDWSFVSPCQRHSEVVENSYQGSAQDQFKLATNYLYGTGGFRKNMERAVYWFTQASNGGEVQALGQLGLCYLEGLGTLKDETLAFNLLKSGAEQGDVNAMLHAAKLASSGRGTAVDHRLATEFLTEAANKGHGPAAYQLGQMYLQGLGVAKDANQAFLYFAQAATAGVMEAHTGLAQCYTDGIGTPVNLQLAKKNWIAASLSGDVLAQRIVGEKLLTGADGFAEYPEKARRYLERAANSGDAQAQYQLALCCYFGIGGPQDLEARDKWLGKAVEQHHAAAITEKQNLNDEPKEIINKREEEGEKTEENEHEGKRNSQSFGSETSDDNELSRVNSETKKKPSLLRRIKSRIIAPSGAAAH